MSLRFLPLYVPTGGQVLSSPSIVSTLSFGAPLITLYLVPGGLPSGASFGTPVIAPGAVALLPPSVASALNFGAAVVTPGPVGLSPESIASGLAFGAPAVALLTDLYPPSIASTAAFGSHTLADAGATIGLVCGQLYIASAIGGDLMLTPVITGTPTLEEC